MERRVVLEPGDFQDLGLPHGVGKDHPVGVLIESPVMDPRARQGTIVEAVAAPLAEVDEVAVSGVGPGGLVGVGEFHPADNSGMNLVGTIEVDAVPVDEPLARPGGSEPHRILVVDRPGPAARNPSWPRIEPDRDPLVHEVRAVSVADLIGRHQAGTVVHRDPGLDLDRFGTAALPFRQPRPGTPDRRVHTGRNYAVSDRLPECSGSHHISASAPSSPAAVIWPKPRVSVRYMLNGSAAVLEDARGKPK